jgi:hypothetical protein
MLHLLLGELASPPLSVPIALEHLVEALQEQKMAVDHCPTPSGPQP